MSTKEIQEWIDGEKKKQKEEPQIFNFEYTEYSNSWIKGLEFAKKHSKKDVLKEFLKASYGSIESSMSDAGYFKALRMVLEK